LFPLCRYIALTTVVKIRVRSPKQAQNEQVCVTKCDTGSNFSKTSLGLLCTRGIVVVHIYCGFSLRRQMASQQTTKFPTEMCGLRIRPLGDADPQIVLDPRTDSGSLVDGCELTRILFLDEYIIF